MADGMDVFNGTTRKKDPEFHFVSRLFSDCSIDYVLISGSILRMNPLEPLFPDRHALFRGEAIYAIPLLGEMRGVSSCYLPDPAPRMRESLCFRQVSLALPQLFVGSLALGNLKAQIFIGSSQLCCSLRNSFLKLVSCSRSNDHQQCENQKHEIINGARHGAEIRVEEMDPD